MRDSSKKTFWKVLLIVVSAVVILSSGATAVANIKKLTDKTNTDSTSSSGTACVIAEIA